MGVILPLLRINYLSNTKDTSHIFGGYKMNRIVEVGSVFGNVQRTSYEYMKLLEKKYKSNYSVLIVDDKDGLNSIPFANHGANVTMYESNLNYINGGIVDGTIITPISNRKHWDNVKNRITIKNSNFYNERIENKYDLVYCYRSLHDKNNKNIPMKRKIRKLLSSVKDDGYIYIFYYLAKNENDYSNFSRSQYFRLGEMKQYFDSRVWNVISIVEHTNDTFHNGHPFHQKDHTHRVGHIFAQKKNTRLVHKYYYEIITMIAE